MLSVNRIDSVDKVHVNNFNIYKNYGKNISLIFTLNIRIYAMYESIIWYIHMYFCDCNLSLQVVRWDHKTTVMAIEEFSGKYKKCNFYSKLEYLRK